MSPGRPPLPPDRKRTERVSVALSRSELDRVMCAAMRLRMLPSEFIRLMVVPDHVTVFTISGSESNTETDEAR